MSDGVMRTSSALRHVEHLAALGLRPHIAIPEMLRTLSATAPGTRASFAWIGDGGRIEDTCHADRDRTAGTPAGQAAPAVFQLHLNAAGRTVALISVSRATPLCERERRLFRAALPMLERAMAHAPSGGEPFYDVPELTSVLVCSADGRLVSADARALLLLAEMDGRPLSGTDVALATAGDLLPAMIGDAIRRASRGAAERTIERVTRWGAFHARIHPQLDGERVTSAVVVLSKHLPRRVALMRALQRLDLSPRERQVAFHLGNGVGATAGAAAMGVSITTWRSYVKRVYVRLDVRDRLDLFARLNIRAAA